MENWKRAVIAGSAGVATILMLKGKRPAGVLAAGIGLAVLASEYPEKFEQIREEIPSYVRQGMRFLDLTIPEVDVPIPGLIIGAIGLWILYRMFRESLTEPRAVSVKPASPSPSIA